MKIKIINKNENEITFLLEESTPQFANALRRICVEEVPVLAIETVDFIENDSVFHDEILAHRLALVPFSFDKDELNLPDECKCEGKGCSQCQTVLVLEKKGPATVYAKDLKSDSKSVKAMYPDMPIVELADGQKIKLEATAILGIGRKHAKWQASRSFYREYPLISVDGKINNAEDAEKICPKNALKLTGKASVTEDCDICGECVKIAEPKGSLKITGDRTRFIFTVETISGLSPEEIVLGAVDVLKKKLSEFGKQI